MYGKMMPPKGLDRPAMMFCSQTAMPTIPESLGKLLGNP